MILPVDPATLAAFALTATAIVVSPGPDTLLILKYALCHGRRAGFAAVLGVQVGLMVHTTLAVAGISALIAASPVLLRAVAIAGAVYLAWLGVQSLRGGLLRIGGDVRRVRPNFSAWRDAVLTNILNPKVILLFLGLYPNFLVMGRGDVTWQLITLSGLLIILNTIWQIGLALAARTAGRWLGSGRSGRAIQATTGVLLIGFAGLLLIKHAV